MEHSLKAYLERLPAETLEVFLRNCKETDQEDQYQYILPLIRDVLLKKQNK